MARTASTEARTPQACDQCRRRKTKCNGVKPRCRNCLKRNSTCSWPDKLAPGGYYALHTPESPHVKTQYNVFSVADKPPVEDQDLDIADPLLQRCLDVFFARHHSTEFCAFLHRPSLDIRALAGRSPLLVAAIVTLSALYISDEEARRYKFESASDLSDFYANIARSHARILSDEPSVPTIQGLLILAIRELLTWRGFKSWMYAGSAIRMSYALQLGSEFSQRHSPRQREIRRRTFWACFVVDRLISYSTSRPLTIHQWSARVQLPCPENAFAFEEDYIGPRLDNFSQYSTQVSKLGVTPYFIALVQLWGEMGTLHTSGGRRRLKTLPNDPNGEYYQKNRALTDFIADLPPSLHWSPQNYKLHQLTGQAQVYINLNLLLQHARCVMNQEYLPQLDSQYTLSLEPEEAASYDSAGLSLDNANQDLIKPCIDAAHQITDIAIMLSSSDDEQTRETLRSTFAANAIMTAAAIHVWIRYTQTCDACPKHVAKANAEILLGIIESWQASWPVASAWAETLELLYKLYEFSYGTGMGLDVEYWGEKDEIQSPPIVEEAFSENGGHPGLSHGDGLPDPSMICQRLFDKVRGLMLSPLQPTDVKKRTMRIYCRTLWQHMWSYDPVQSGNSELLPPENVLNPMSLTFEDTLFNMSAQMPGV